MVGTDRAHRATWRRMAATILVAAAAVLLLAAPALAGTPVRSVSAAPAAFIPDWDGESDSTRITVRVNAPGYYRIDVVDRRGRLADRLAGRTRLRHRTTRIHWDGRLRNGRTAPPGTYRVRVTPLRVTGRRIRARAASRAATVRVRQAPVAVRDVRVKRAIISRSRRAGLPELQFRLNRRASASAVVRTSSGEVVANIFPSQSARGTARARWDGRTDFGKYVPDGTYQVALAATGGGSPTATVEIPVLVDRTSPRIRAAGTSTGKATRRGASASLRMRVTEDVKAAIRIQGKGVRSTVNRQLDANTRSLELVPADFGRRNPRPGTYRVNVTVTDDAGNRSRRKLRLVLRKSASPPNPSTPPGITPQPSAGRMLWPAVGTVTSEYGPRWGRMHQGIDIANSPGTPIISARGGIVSFAGEMGGYGKAVIIEHPGGVSTLYGHMSRVDAVAGQLVGAGQGIGLMGSTGHSTGSHLHFEVRVGGEPQDPRRVLPRR